MKRPQYFFTALLISLLAIIAMALRIDRPAPVLAGPPAMTDQAQTPAGPPALAATVPANGATWAGEPVQLIFDRPMDSTSATFLTVTPELAGVASVDGATVLFTPSVQPVPDQRYLFSLAAKAQSADGVALNAPVDLAVVAAGPLQVTSTQPGDLTNDIGVDTPLVVVFNRPVVPLSGLDAQSDLPQPLRIEPAVEGSGAWVNTSMYRFTPTAGWAGATTYAVTVDGLTGLAGETLAAPVNFSFTTAAPMVVNVEPSGQQVEPTATIYVDFSQPMDPASTETAFALFNQSDGPDAAVAGAFDWAADDTSFVFTPTDGLTFGATYGVRVDERALPRSRSGTLRTSAENTFTVVPLPAVVATTPADGAVGVPPDRLVTVQFTAPLSYTTVLENVTVTPGITTSQVYSYYNEYSSELTLSWFMEANSTYTVTLGADMADLYGNTVGEETVFSFTTGDQPPYTRINLDRFTHFSAASMPTVSAYYRNMDELTATLYRLPVGEFYRLTGGLQWEVWQDYTIPNAGDNQIWAQDFIPGVGPNVTGEIYIELLDEQGNLLPPGLYLLEMNSPPPRSDADPASPPVREQKVIVLSNHGIVYKKSDQGDSLAWITDLVSGDPVAGLPVQFVRDGEVKAEGTTDADGLALAPVPPDPETPWWPMVAISGSPGDPEFTVATSEWNEGIGPWEYGINGGYSAPPYTAYFYSDRPIYRPGQTVYWKGILRTFREDQYALPPSATVVKIVIRDDRGNEVYSREEQVNSMGTLFGEMVLAPDAFTGTYFLEATIVGLDTNFFGAGMAFQVASYRKPEFEISISTSQPEYVQGDTVAMSVDASYFSGGPLPDAPVDWTAITAPYTFSWQGGPTDRYFSFRPYDPADFNYDPYGSPYYGGSFDSGRGTTDADGRFVLQLPADLQDSPSSQVWQLRATVQSSTNQFVSGGEDVVIHKTDFYVGLSPRSSVVTVGEEATVDLVAVEALGAPNNPVYPGATLAVTVYEFEWSSVYERAADGIYRWRNEVARTPVYTDTVTTGRDGMAAVVWTPTRGGQYQVEARGQDEKGNQVNAATYVWASNEAAGDFVVWPRDNNDRIELVRDQELYAPGDTAKVLIPSPFAAPLKALVTLERGGVMETQILEISSNSHVLEIPITSDHIPNIYVSVVLVKGVDEGNPTPAMRLGYVELPVDIKEKELALTITPSTTTLAPGDTVSYTLAVQDEKGDPVSDAEVSVALVDKAVLSLAQGSDASMLDIFYYRRPLGVTTSALLNINQDRLSQQLTDGAKGGGGGGGGGLAEVRQDFPDVAFWRADFISDAAGLIEFQVDLPDNLTTWVLVAKAVNADTHVGEASNEIVTTKTLQVRPVLPRFFTAGDRARIGAVIVNSSDTAITDGVITLDLAGVELAQGEPSVGFALEPGRQSRVEWSIAVTDVASGTVTMAASAGADDATLTDGVILTLPVNRYETPETVATSGTVPPEGRTESVLVPADATDNGLLTIGMEGSLAAGMLDGLDYLEHYAYECNEQTVSRFLPNLMTVRALRAAGVSDAELESQLSFQLGVGVQRLTSRQNADGGWGYWPAEASTPFITSYVLWGLATAAELGYPIPPVAVDAAARYLDESFVNPADEFNQWTLNEMAFAHFVLAEIGRADAGRMSTLFAVNERLSLYGQAFLAMALHNVEPTDARIDTLLDNLFGAAQFSATGASWHEDDLNYNLMDTDIRTTAIVLTAFIRLDPGQPLLPQAVRWLMSAREHGHWASTQETAWSLMALTDWLVASNELAGDYTWQVGVNPGQVTNSEFSGTVNADTLREKESIQLAITDLLRDQANTIRFDRSNESGQLYYTMDLRYNLDALAVDARDRGVAVARTFSVADQRTNSADVGDVISMAVTIVAPADRHHLLVEVPLPAGVEPIDSSLATEPDFYNMPQLDAMNSRGAGDWTPSYIDVRDDKVALFATYLPAGAYQFTFQVRATLAGEFRVLPVHAQEMYFPDVWGRSAGELFTVRQSQ